MIIISQNGPDSQDEEEVLLSDSEKFEPTGEIIGSEIY
jgi:hypothetical protein